MKTDLSQTFTAVWLSILLQFASFHVRAATPDALEARKYVVQVSAADNGSQIELTWPLAADANGYNVYRKAKTDTSWTFVVTRPASSTGYSDPVTVGTHWEYQIEKTTSLGYTGYGYVYGGRQLPLPEDRGKIVLVVASSSSVNVANDLASELTRLQEDLTGDGWTVVRLDVARPSEPYHPNGHLTEAVNVREAIKTAYNADTPKKVRAVLLFGRVPVARSGNYNPDGHTLRAFPADVFYGDMNGTWTPNGSTYPYNDLGSFDIEIQVGRVDFAEMDELAAVNPPTEIQLLRQYLNKNHDFRHKQGVFVNIPRHGLIASGDWGPLESHNIPVASGYRIMAPFCNQITTTGAGYETDQSERWMTYLMNNTYLWAFGVQGGDHDAIFHLKNNGWMKSRDVYTDDPRAVFMMVFGSHFAEWDYPDDYYQGNFLRSMIAAPTYVVACTWVGRPHHYYHHMGLGESIGYGVRLSQVNNGLYKNEVENHARQIHVALMGDPTLRMHPVTPPSNLVGAMSSAGVTLNWTASTDSNIQGYHVYKSNAVQTTFQRVNGTIIPAGTTTFTDSSATSGIHTYMVRAIKLETGSGTYFNPSQGIFVTVASPLVAAGWFHSAAVQLNGTVWTWGDNYAGQLGHGTLSDLNAAQQITGFGNIRAVAAGGWHTLFLKNDGTVWACGYNYYGQLGNDPGVNKPAPVQVLVGQGQGGLNNVVAIAAGDYSSYALKSDGTVWAWGNNYNGQLGTGDYVQNSYPVKVRDLWEPYPDDQLKNVIAITAGGSHCMALKSDGTLRSWGWNAYGQLGNGTTTQSTLARKVYTSINPVPVELSGVVAISAGAMHSTALKGSGSLLTWGYDGAGQLGNGAAITADQLMPTTEVLGQVTAIAAGSQYCLAVKTGGTVWAWGANGSGQLGLNDQTPRSAPVQLTSGNLSAAAAVAAGGSHSLAIQRNRTLRSWGNHTDGQLGIGSAVSPQKTPVPLVPEFNF